MKPTRRYLFVSCFLLSLLCLSLSRGFAYTDPQERLDRALIAAIKKSDPKAVHRLLEEGANPNALEDPGNRTLTTALFLSLGIRVSTQGTTILFPFRLRPNASIVTDLLSEGADTQLKDRTQSVILIVTKWERFRQGVRLFVRTKNRTTLGIALPLPQKERPAIAQTLQKVGLKEQ